MSNVMEIIVRAVDQASNVLNNIGRQGEQATKNLEKSFKNAGKAMSDTGKSLSKNVTAPLVGVGVLATKASIDLETAFTGVIKTVDATEQELRELKQGFETMAKTVPIATTELYGIGEAAGQLGIKKENILGFSDVMAKLGVTTNMSSDQAATALARLANITQMPQTEFDRLGATIVALGNNLATTEAEIVEMGLRIAGAGSQVGLTEAQILSFAGALSSVGIEAESGGSAISRVMVDMANAVASGGQKLEQFAQVSGMSASQFQQAFEKDAAGAIISFIEGLDKTAKSGGNVFAVLEDLGLSEIRVRDALLRAAGAGDLFRESLELGSEAWVENNALNKEAELRFETTASKIQLFKNQLQLTANTFGEALLPVISKALEGITPLIQRFSELSDGTKRTIFVIAGLAAAVGPVLVILGKVVGAVGTLIGTFGKLKTAWGAFTALTGPVGIAVAAIAGLTAGGIALYNHLSKEAIPEVQRFGDEVSESTQKAVGAFLDLNDQATVALNQLSWSGQTVTQEMANNITSIFDQMGDQVLTAMQEDHAQQLQSMQEFFAQSSSLTEQEETAALEKMKQHQQQEQQTIQQGQQRIAEILNTAKEQKRAITDAERQEINQIQQEMVNTGIQVLSKSELEQKAILERMKANAATLSAQQAAEVVRNSKKQKDEAIKAAEEQYNEVVKEIIRQRDEVGSISKEQADKLIQEATKQRDEAVKKATDMHNKVVEEAKKQAGEHVNEVNWETGEVLTKWETFKNSLTRKWDKIKTKAASVWESVKKAITKPIKEAKETILDIIEKIKSAFANMKITIPKPKLPHVSVSVRYKTIAGAKIPYPDFDINWYAQGGIFTRPSIIGVGEGRYDEAVIPLSDSVLSKLAEMIASKMNLAGAGVGGGGGPTQSIIDYERLGQVLAQYIKPAFAPQITVKADGGNANDIIRKEEQLLRQLAIMWEVQ